MAVTSVGTVGAARAHVFNAHVFGPRLKVAVQIESRERLGGGFGRSGSTERLVKRRVGGHTLGDLLEEIACEMAREGMPCSE